MNEVKAKACPCCGCPAMTFEKRKRDSSGKLVKGTYVCCSHCAAEMFIPGHKSRTIAVWNVMRENWAKIVSYQEIF